MGALQLDISNEEYHAREEVSAGMLKSMAAEWRIFEAHHVTKCIQREETPAMRMGTALHAAVLEPWRFREEYRVIPDECRDRRTKKYKEWSAALPHDVTVLTEDEHGSLKEAAKSVRNHGTIKALEGVGASNKTVEASLIYRDQSGVNCRCRPDMTIGHVCIDLKTTKDPSAEAFAKTVSSFRYDLQAAHYLAGLDEWSPGPWVFYFAAVELSPPFRCRVYTVDMFDLEYASDQRAALLHEYRQRKESNDWSDDGEDSVLTISLPPWHRKGQ